MLGTIMEAVDARYRRPSSKFKALVGNAEARAISGLLHDPAA